MYEFPLNENYLNIIYLIVYMYANVMSSGDLLFLMSGIVVGVLKYTYSGKYDLVLIPVL